MFRTRGSAYSEAVAGRVSLETGIGPRGARKISQKKDFANGKGFVEESFCGFSYRVFLSSCLR